MSAPVKAPPFLSKTSERHFASVCMPLGMVVGAFAQRLTVRSEVDGYLFFVRADSQHVNTLCSGAGMAFA